jgi:hypothetical protein
MKVQMTLISKGLKVSKICTTEKEVRNFERDMPYKYNLTNKNISFAIGSKNLEE